MAVALPTAPRAIAPETWRAERCPKCGEELGQTAWLVLPTGDAVPWIGCELCVTRAWLLTVVAASLDDITANRLPEIKRVARRSRGPRRTEA